VDIVVPVFRALRHVRSCLDSLSRFSEDAPVHLIVVDDASGDDVNRALRECLARWGDRATLLTNERNAGFLPTANRGMRAGNAPTVVILNSDTIVSAGWLAGILRCLHDASDIGIVSPLSNYANLARVAFPYGSHVELLARTLRSTSPHSYPEIHFASGSCMAVRRKLLEELDFFDSRYGRGYFEETDLCLRAAERGWRTVADDATYVHHHGWASFGSTQRSALMERNAELFAERWGAGTHRSVQRRVRRQKPFAEVERRLALALAGTAQVRPQRKLPNLGNRNVAERALSEDDIRRSTQSEPTWRRRSAPTWERIAAIRDETDMRTAGDILFVIDDLLVNPWSTDVLHIADLLLECGLDVSVATAGDIDPAVLADPCRLLPYVLAGPDELIRTVRAHRTIVATSPSCVYDALLLKERDGSRVVGWFQNDVIAPRLVWPGDGLALAAAFGLVEAHLVAGNRPQGARPNLQVPIGVDPDSYGHGEGAARSGVLVTHSAWAGPAASRVASQVVTALRESGTDVSIYGDGLPDADDVVTHPLAPQEIEAGYLTRHRAVVEATPIPGLERFRLRAAAAGIPLVASVPVGPGNRLTVGSAIFGAPRGDPARLCSLARGILDGTLSTAARVKAAREQALQVSLRAEAEAIARAVASLSLKDRGRPSEASPRL
jgi:GT2 family glycosyltransferase